MFTWDLLSMVGAASAVAVAVFVFAICRRADREPMY
jgi:hypothetical protein